MIEMLIFCYQKSLSNNDGILILNKQIEDMTFHIDELKSELEAEREKNNEYAAEIDIFKSREKNRVDDLGIENERLNKELIDALFLDKDQEKLMGTNSKLVKYKSALKDELVERENFDILDMDNFERENFSALFGELCEKLKIKFEQRDKRLDEESEKVRYTETQLEKIIKEFKVENESLEIRLNDKIHEHNSLKSQVI